LTDEEKTLYLRCGSPGYVAPELLDDRGYDTQADTFSAGVIMYVMLTGRPLFRGDNISEILEKNKNCQFEFPKQYWDQISPVAKDLVQAMLKNDPNERVTASQALQHEWFKPNEDVIDNVIKIDVEEFKVRDERPGEKATHNPMVTVTPVMAGRKLNTNVPESPFLTSNNLTNLNNTPVMRKVMIDDTNKQRVQIGGITIIRPGQAADSKPVNKLGLPEIP